MVKNSLPIAVSVLALLSGGCSTSAPDSDSARIAEWQKTIAEWHKTTAEWEKTPSQPTSPSATCAKLVEPRPLTSRFPEYAPELRKQRVEGLVLLTAVIGTDGIARDAKLVSSPHSGLADSCASYVLRTKYDPAVCDGIPVEVVKHYSCSYILH